MEQDTKELINAILLSVFSLAGAAGMLWVATKVVRAAWGDC